MSDDNSKTETPDPELDGKTDSSPDPKPAEKDSTGGRGPTSPRKVRTYYPDRDVIYLRINTTELKNLGVAQTGTTINAAIGTFFLTLYWDLTKDIGLLKAAGDPVPEFYVTQVDIYLLTSGAFFVFAFLAFLWRRNQISRIKEEHNIPTLRARINAWVNKIVPW